MRKLSCKEDKFNFKPWITKGLRKSINNKNILYRHFIGTKSSYSHHKYNIYITTNLQVYYDGVKSFTTTTILKLTKVMSKIFGEV